MDDNELENEREKRKYELELARLRYPWNSFLEICRDGMFWVFLILLSLSILFFSL